MTFPVAPGYSYKADPFQCVHDGLRVVVGAGKGWLHAGVQVDSHAGSTHAAEIPCHDAWPP